MLPTLLRSPLPAALAALLAAGCSAAESSDLVAPPLDAKADSLPSVFDAGSLMLGPLGEEVASEVKSEDFSSGVYRFHGWLLSALPASTLIIDTGGTFEPALLVRSWVEEERGRVSFEQFWITPDNGLTHKGQGRYEATLVMSGVARWQGSYGSPPVLLLTSAEAAADSDASVAKEASYEIQAVPLEPERLDVTMLAEDSSGVDEVPVGPIHLEYRDVGRLTITPEDDALYGRLEMRVAEPTGRYELRRDGESVYGSVDLYDEAGELERRVFPLSSGVSSLTLEFYDDTELDIIDGEDAVVEELGLYAIPNEELWSRSAVDLRRPTPDRLAPQYER